MARQVLIGYWAMCSFRDVTRPWPAEIRHEAALEVRAWVDLLGRAVDPFRLPKFIAVHRILCSAMRAVA